jgi:hypothetical protein
VIRHLHRLLVLAALTLVVGGGVWMLRVEPSPADEASQSTAGSDAMAVSPRGKGGIATVRLRTPAPPAAVTAWRWESGNDGSQRPALGHAAAAPRSTRLYALLRVYRI